MPTFRASGKARFTLIVGAKSFKEAERVAKQMLIMESMHQGRISGVKIKNAEIEKVEIQKWEEIE